MKVSVLLAAAVVGLGMIAGVAGANTPARGGRGGRDGAAVNNDAQGGINVGGRGARAGAGRAGRRGAATNPTESSTGDGVRGGRGAGIDQREQNQKRRIEQGIKQGQLTPDEVTKLKGLEKNISEQEATYKADGKLTKEEAQKLHKSLNEASLQIWSERHDTEGNQKAAMVLGKDVFANDAITAKLESGNLTGAEAKAFLGDFHKLVTMKRRLGADNLTPEVRAKLQADYNDLLNKYFTTK